MAYFKVVTSGFFFRTLHVDVEVLGTVNSIYVLQLNCKVVKKMELFVPPTCFISPWLIIRTCALFVVGTRIRAPEVPNAKQTGETVE